MEKRIALFLVSVIMLGLIIQYSGCSKLSKSDTDDAQLPDNSVQQEIAAKRVMSQPG